MQKSVQDAAERGVTADFGPRPEATADNPHPRPAMLPDSFVVLVVGK